MQAKPERKGWFVYILDCADGTLYTGITNNLKKRIAAHNAGKGAKYTRGRGPVALVFKKRCVNKSGALKQEAKIKKLNRTGKREFINKKTGPKVKDWRSK